MRRFIFLKLLESARVMHNERDFGMFSMYIIRPLDPHAGSNCSPCHTLIYGEDCPRVTTGAVRLLGEPLNPELGNS
jgi:hypothetical protein